MGGPLAFFGGFTAYSANYLCNNLEVFGDADHEFSDKVGRYWFYLSVMLWNPLNTLIVRMQCVEFSLKRLHRAVIDLVRHDKHRMFYRGLFPIFTGQV